MNTSYLSIRRSLIVSFPDRRVCLGHFSVIEETETYVRDICPSRCVEMALP